MTPSPRLKTTASQVLRFVITAALVSILLRRTDVRAVGDVFRRSNPFLMALAFALFFGLNILIFLRWRILVSGLKVRVSSFSLFLTYLASHFVNLCLPSTIGGDALRTLETSRHANHHSGGILATVILDRLFGFIGLVTVLGVVLIFGWRVFHDPGILVASFLMVVTVIILTLVMFSGGFFRGLARVLPQGRVKEYFFKIHEASLSFRQKKGLLVEVWLISVGAHTGLCFMYYLIARAAGIGLGFLYCLIFVPVVTVCSVIPVSIGGLGVRDAASVVLFAAAGLRREEALTLSLVHFIFILFLGLMGAGAYVINHHRRRV